MLTLNHPGWMAQTPIVIAGSADGGEAVSGVQDGDIIVALLWGNGNPGFVAIPSTPSGYTSRYSGQTGRLGIRIATKVAASESGTWAGTWGRQYVWIRNASGIFTIGSIIGGNGTSYDMTSFETPSNGALLASIAIEAPTSSNLDFDSADFSGWSATNNGFFGSLSSGEKQPYSKLKTKKQGPGSTGAPTFKMSGSADDIAGIMFHVS